MENTLKRVNTIYKDCGIGRIAAIVQIKDVVSFTKNPIRTICLYHYYLYLSKYLNYDKVYIVSNIPTPDKKYWICNNILKDLPIIYGTVERGILNRYNIDDLYMHQSTPNFYGGTIFPHYPFNINRITEWWLEHHDKGGRLYYIQDDPLFPNSNLAKICNKRLFDTKNVYCTYSKAAPKELVDLEIKLTESMRDDIDRAMKDSILAFCGIDYEKFWYSIKEDSRPEVNKWDIFSCYLWQGVNDNLDIKLVDYPWAEKKYDSEYHGVTKSGKRTKVTEAYYSALRNKFLHITGRSPFFSNLSEGKDFDKHDVMEYYDLLQYVAKNSKSAFITHEDSILGNQISPRYFDCMLSDIIAFCDIRYDPNKQFTNNEELKDFMYVSTPEEFSNKVDMISNNETYYKHIKYLQRKSIFDNFDSSADYCYSGLLKAEEKIVSFLNGVNISPTKSNTRYFLTGHSLGAACAGKVGIMLVKKGHAKAQNIYSYTYATPTYTTDPTERSKVPGQFNIINEKDTMVPNMPSVMFNGIIFIPAFRGGTDKYYGKNNGTFKNVLWQLYGYVPDEVGDGRPWIQHSAHMTPVYLAYLLADLQQSEINRLFSRARLVSAHCPVDVEVYDADGKLCAYTRGGEVEYCGNCAVLITVIGDEKYIAVPDGEYTIRYIGTDTGTMRIEDQILDSDTGEVTDERVFDGLAVETGKVFGGIADAALDVIDTEIFVLDAEGDKIKSVNEEGEETLLAKYTLTDDMIEFEKGQRFLYTGEPIMPEVTVAGLEKGVDYRLIYNDNTNTGHATVTVKGINEYAGRFTYGFDITAEGNCTDSISWSLDGNGTLMISGTGSMGEPEWDDNRWWYANRESVKNVIIESGITDIAEKTFYNHSAMSVIRLPESVTAIGSGTFTGCTGLKDVYFGGLQTDWDGVTIGTDNGALTDASLHCAIPEHDHVWGEWDITQAASCTEKGKRTRTCTICEEADVEEIPVTGHTPSNPVRENVVPATCEGNGSYDEVVYCSVCRAELSRETKTEEKLGHNWGEWIITKEPNKNEAGEKQRTCSRCDAAEKQVIPKINTGDLNGDDLRDYSDLEILIQCLHGTQAQDIMLSAADINGDTYVDYNDMALLANTIEVGMTTELAARFLNSGFQYEANLVLQCAVGLIDAFPAEPSIPVLDTAPENVTDASVLDLDAAAEEAEYTGNDQMTSEPDADYEADEGLTEVNTEQSDDVIDLVLEPELNNESEPVLLPEPVQIPAPEETKQNENASESESNDQ